MPAPYQDPSRPVEERVADVLGRMSIDDKLAQLGCLWVSALIDGDHVDHDAARRLLQHGMGHITRIGASTSLRPRESAELMNEIQRIAVETGPLGIPIIVHEESTGGFCARDATVFPQGLALAATWDPGLVGEVAAVIREQMRAVGARHTLAPVLDVARDPRWGRVEETYGEDPVLAGTIGAAYVRSMQTDDLRNGVIATGKHFLGYAMSEGGMNHAPVQLGPRELREVYAEPFAAAIRDAGLASVMNSYSSVDGLPCAGSRAILTGLLRDELGFDGVVVADYDSVNFLVHHHRVAADKAEAAARALGAGLDMELPAVDCFGEPLRDALDRGLVTGAMIDDAVRSVLRTKFRLGLFERPFVDAAAATAVYDTPPQRALARRAVARSAVLLTNDGTLPLAAAARIAVIGPVADDRRLLQGDYHYPAHLEIAFDNRAKLTGDFVPGEHFTPHVTVLEGLRAAGCSVTSAPGCSVTGDDRSGFDAAVALASDADVAVVCVGGRSGLVPSATVGEARDASDLALTGVQEDLVAAVAATGTPTVVVVVSGRVHTLSRVCDLARAVLWTAPPGEEGGNGLADVLLGRSDPGGRLPVSLPRSVGQVPVYAAHRAGGGRSIWYGGYSDGPTTPLFRFGHGLSYTSWEYSALSVVATTTADPVTVDVTVANVGARRGEEVVGLFVTDRVASVARPVAQLLGFTRVAADPGSAARVRFEVHPSRLAFYDEAMRFVVEPGTFSVRVGPLRETFSLTGAVASYLQRSVVATRATVLS